MNNDLPHRGNWYFDVATPAGPAYICRWATGGAEVGRDDIELISMDKDGATIGRRIKAFSRRVEPELWAWYELMYDNEHR